MTNHPHIHGAGRLIKTMINDLPPVYGKSRLLAGFIGFLFGGLGLGLYFWSWRDFLYPVVIFGLSVFLLGSALPVVGVLPGYLLGILFATVWGVWRAW